MEANKKLSPIVSAMFLRERKLNISIVFISQSYFKVPVTVRLNVTNYFIMKITHKRELQQLASNHLSNIEFKDFVRLYKDYTKQAFFIFSEKYNFTMIIQKIKTTDNKIKQNKAQLRTT